jgi:hypothetical protein
MADSGAWCVPISGERIRIHNTGIGSRSGSRKVKIGAIYMCGGFYFKKSLFLLPFGRQWWCVPISEE